MDPRPAKAISARVVVAVVAALVAVGAGGAVEFARLLPGLEQDSVNQRFERRGTQPAPGLLVVAIDDKTFDDLQLQWPFPRSRHGQAIDRLHRDGASAIVYDVQFTEQTKPREDNALIDAVGRARNVVLAPRPRSMRTATATCSAATSTSRPSALMPAPATCPPAREVCCSASRRRPGASRRWRWSPPGASVTRPR